MSSKASKAGKSSKPQPIIILDEDDNDLAISDPSQGPLSSDKSPSKSLIDRSSVNNGCSNICDLPPSKPSELCDDYLSGSLDHRFKKEEVEVLRRELLKWYHANRRKLPWRGDDLNGVSYSFPNPYGTWVSEVMCQQTRVETVIPYWVKWMEEFPTVSALAMSTPEKINSLWAGLGYYRRARMLHTGAQKICSDLGGVIPSSEEGLLSVPGIGRYTAGAIGSIAFGRATGAVDGNVIRVLSRLRAVNFISSSNDMGKLTWELANAIVDPSEPGSFNQALMELGAMICKPQSPECEVCPVRSVCYARSLVEHRSSYNKAADKSKGKLKTTKPKANNKNASEIVDIEDLALPISVTEFPRKAPKKKPRMLIMPVVALAWVDDENADSAAKYLVVKRPQGGLLGNQWEFPTETVWDSESHKLKGSKSIESVKLSSTTKPLGKSTSVKSEVDNDDNDLLEDDNDNDNEDNELPVIPEAALLQKLLQYMLDTLGLKVALNPDTSLQEISLANGGNASTALSEAVWSFDSLRAEKQPIVHVFSHQVHNMQLFTARVHLRSKSATTKRKGSTVKGNSSSSSNNSNSNSNSNNMSEDDAGDLHWLSSGSEPRAVKWMAESELIAAGITTGCKKVLEKAKMIMGLDTGIGGAGSKRKISDFFVKGGLKK